MNPVDPPRHDAGHPDGSPVPLICAPNFRDLGGLPAADGRRLAAGLVFRSEAVLAPGDDDARVLGAHGIRLVCDLRGRHERSVAPNNWWPGQGAALLEMDLNALIEGEPPWHCLRDDPKEAGAEAMMYRIYAALPAAAAGHLRMLFERIAAGDVPLLVHCTAGKDRTGVVVALLLSALGVPRAVIRRDYLLSATRLHPQVVQATEAFFRRALDQPVSPEALAVVCGVRAAYLDASFAAVEAAHGSVPAYLRDAAGLTPELEQAVRSALLIPCAADTKIEH